MDDILIPPIEIHVARENEGIMREPSSNAVYGCREDPNSDASKHFSKEKSEGSWRPGILREKSQKQTLRDLSGILLYRAYISYVCMLSLTFTCILYIILKSDLEILQ